MTDALLRGAQWGEGSVRDVIMQDATAVLAFDDATHIPCDRFIMRCFSPVLRRVLEDTSCAADPLGRLVLPLPGQPSAPYWDAVDALHGCKEIRGMDLHRLLALAACLDYLGVTALDGALDARLWALLQHEPLEVCVRHAPRLMRNPALAGPVMRHLMVQRPTWQGFRRDVLEAVRAQGDLDHVTAKAVAQCATHFFPVPLVVAWVLSSCRALALDPALDLCSHHATMVHPVELPRVFRALAGAVDQAPISDPKLAKVLRMAVTANETYDAVPFSGNKAHGSVLMFSDAPLISVAIVLPQGRPPARVRAAPWLKLLFCSDGRMDVRFVPRSMDPAVAAAKHIQLRVMSVQKADDAAVGEAWYFFDRTDSGDVEGGGIGGGIGGAEHEYTLAHAASTMGDIASVTGMVREQLAAYLRLDFFFGATNILARPFEC